MKRGTSANPIITEERVIEYLKIQDTSMVSTADMMEFFGTTRPATIRRLNQFCETTELEKMKMGNSWAWYLPGEVVGENEAVGEEGEQTDTRQEG